MFSQRDKPLLRFAFTIKVEIKNEIKKDIGKRTIIVLTTLELRTFINLISCISTPLCHGAGQDINLMRLLS